MKGGMKLFIFNSLVTKYNALFRILVVNPPILRYSVDIRCVVCF